MPPLLKRLRAFLRTYLYRQNMSFSDEALELKIEPAKAHDMDTLLYYGCLCRTYKSIEDAENFRVTEISIMKSPSMAQHELLLAKLTDTKRGTNHELTLERFGLPESANRRKSSSSSSLPPTTSSQSLTDSVNNLSASSKIVSSIDTPAHDRVRWQNPSISKLQKVMRLPIPPNQPVYLYNLLAIATIISREFPNYTLLKRNCYFYAGIIFALVYQLVEKDLPPFRREKTKAGTWNNFVQIFDDNKPEIVKIINDFQEKYTTEVDSFLAQVRTQEEQRNKAARVDHAEERANAAEAKLQEERAKLQEERAKAQQLEAHIRDLHAQLASSHTHGPSIQLTDYH
ncbi:hypothetical protein H0H93_003680 [Arthromyces matolae]|nr:hypothetical protein H0H93_003680 [Arthromyces matolae]